MEFTEILWMVRRLREQGADALNQDGWQVERLRGGMNNALYRVEHARQAYAVKLCVPDERNRARREYAALRLLWEADADCAPQALDLDEGAEILPYPVMVYRWLPGKTLLDRLPGQAISERELAALLELVERVHGLEPNKNRSLLLSSQVEIELAEAWFHWFELQPYLDELDGFLKQYEPWLYENLPGGDAIYARLTRIVAGCKKALAESPARIDRVNVPLRLCHVDPNPANLILCADGRLRWVDWEYSGWGDPALDLAEFRWHQEFSCMSEEQTAWMRANYRPPPGDKGYAQRLALWDALLAARWPFLSLRWLWSIHSGLDRERLSLQQAQATEIFGQMMGSIKRAERFFRY